MRLRNIIQRANNLNQRMMLCIGLIAFASAQSRLFKAFAVSIVLYYTKSESRGILGPLVVKKTFMVFPWVVTSTGPGGFMICVFII